MINWSPFLIGSIPLIVNYYANFYRQEDLDKTLRQLEPDLGLPRIITYDFIVIGGGTGGCLLAGRLAQKFNVLLLEEGGNPPPPTYTPYLNENIDREPAINYLYQYPPLENFYLDPSRNRDIWQGKMMGGSGSHNEDVYNRGSPKDWDNFARITGDNSWAYGNVLRYWKSLENFVGYLLNEGQRTQFYSVGGPLNVETDTPPYLSAWLEAGRQLGYRAGDPNGYQIESFTPVAKSTRNGIRESTYTAFIERVESKLPCLTALRYSVGEKIIINDGTAVGIAYKRHGIPQIAHASKEVILSAGTIGTPMLLFKSGVGPRQLLEQAQIPVVLDLPGVGSNLRDHPEVALTFVPRNTAAALTLMSNAKISDSQVEDELNNFQQVPHRGKFTFIVGPQAFIASSVAKQEGEGDWPDYQIFFAPIPLLGGGPGVPPNGSASVVLNRVKSVGRLTFDTEAYIRGERNDTKLAIINPRYLTDQRDTRAMIDGIRLLFRVTQETTPFRDLQLQLDESDFSNTCFGLPPNSDDFWACILSHNGDATQHYQGTCRMGRIDDPMAVVDSKLRVKGVRNLRIVDASIFPVSTNANPNGPTMLVAEKTATEMLQQYCGNKPWPQNIISGK